MQPITNTDAEKLKQLARYLAHGISQEQAGAAVGYSPSRVVQLMEEDEFKEILAYERADLLVNYADINNMYDQIEKNALANLAKIAKISLDFETQYRLAMFANRAMRRGQAATQPNRPLDAANADGTRIAISLSKQFVTIVQNGQLTQTKDVQVQRAELDVASPEDVRQLMNIGDVGAKNIPVGINPMSEVRSLASFLEDAE